MRNRILSLMGEKQAKENRQITAALVAREIGMSRQAIHKWVHNDISNFSSETVENICRYFECQIGDLLYIDHSLS